VRLSRILPVPIALALAACAAPLRSGPVPGEGFIAGADGVRLYYRVAGTGPDTVVVLHGGPGIGHQVLSPNLAPLEARHTVIYWDQRGSGRSTLPDTALLGIERFAEDLEAVRRHFGMERMALFAHSFGPVIGAAYARAYPERVERMVFVGALGPRPADRAAFARARAQQRDSVRGRRFQDVSRRFLTGTPGEAVEACMEYQAMSRAILQEAGWPAGNGRLCDSEPEAVQYGFRYTARLTPRLLGDADLARGLERMTAPLLVVTGDRDETPVPGHAAWAAAVPNGRLLVIPGLAHNPHVEAPDVFFPLLETFLAGGWPEGAVDPAP
jgi:proline iminopeptidase